MGHLALYRQFRPTGFDDVVEQSHAVSALRQAIISGQIAHAYLFCGTRGTGKTTLAKIFARGINCTSPIEGSPCNQCDICRGILENTLLDVIEMDAASNNSVDNIRRICDEVQFLPSRAKYKVYIIDEVHMLSQGAFNALLKTLEEPPSHAVFLLATTEPHRIPATILSRCQRYDFRRIPLPSIIQRLRKIADEQKIDITEDALSAIANLSDGALRDAISLLDQISTTNHARIDREDILKLTGVVDDDFLIAMAEAILTGDSSSVIRYTRQLVMDGRDITRFTLDLAHMFRDMLILFTCPADTDLVQMTAAARDRIARLLTTTSGDRILAIITRLSALTSELKWTPDVKTTFEIALLSFCAKPTGSAATAPVVPAATPVARESVSKPVAKPINPASSVSEPSPPTTASTPAVAPMPAASIPVAPTDIPAAPAVSDVPAQAPDTIPVSKPSLNSSSEVALSEPPPALVPDPALPSVPESVPDTISAPPSAAPALSVSEPAVQPPPSIEEVPPPIEELSAAELQSIAPSDAAREVMSFDDLLPPPPMTDAAPEILSVETVTVAPSVVQPLLSSQPEISLMTGDPVPEAPPTQQTTVASPSQTAKSEPNFDEAWQRLMNLWEDTLFIVFLQLKKAQPHRQGSTLQIVFPDFMKNYTQNLTQTQDYKTITKDIQSKMPYIEAVTLLTQKEFQSGAADTKSADAAPAGQEWMEQMISFAENAGITVETTDKL